MFSKMRRTQEYREVKRSLLFKTFGFVTILSLCIVAYSFLSSRAIHKTNIVDSHSRKLLEWDPEGLLDDYPEDLFTVVKY